MAFASPLVKVQGGARCFDEGAQQLLPVARSSNSTVYSAVDQNITNGRRAMPTVYVRRFDFKDSLTDSEVAASGNTRWSSYRVPESQRREVCQILFRSRS